MSPQESRVQGLEPSGNPGIGAQGDLEALKLAAEGGIRSPHNGQKDPSQCPCACKAVPSKWEEIHGCAEVQASPGGGWASKPPPLAATLANLSWFWKHLPVPAVHTRGTFPSRWSLTVPVSATKFPPRGFLSTREFHKTNTWYSGASVAARDRRARLHTWGQLHMR